MTAVQVPGKAWRVIREGGYPQDEPDRFARLEAAVEVRRRGRGSTAYITGALSDDLADVADYLASYLGAVESMSASERDGEDPRALRRALDALTAGAAEARTVEAYQRKANAKPPEGPEFRPFVASAEFYTDKGTAWRWCCRYCHQDLDDQSLRSWEYCCTEFEMALLLDRFAPGPCPVHESPTLGECPHCDWVDLRRDV